MKWSKCTKTLCIHARRQYPVSNDFCPLLLSKYSISTFRSTHRLKLVLITFPTTISRFEQYLTLIVEVHFNLSKHTSLRACPTFPTWYKGWHYFGEMPSYRKTLTSILFQNCLLPLLSERHNTCSGRNLRQKELSTVKAGNSRLVTIP